MDAFFNTPSSNTEAPALEAPALEAPALEAPPDNVFKELCQTIEVFQEQVIDKIEKMNSRITNPRVGESYARANSADPETKNLREFYAIVLKLRYVEERFKQILIKLKQRIKTMTELSEYKLMLHDIVLFEHNIERRNSEFKTQLQSTEDTQAVDEQIKINRRKIYELKKIEIVKRKYLRMVTCQKAMKEIFRGKVNTIEKQIAASENQGNEEPMNVNEPETEINEGQNGTENQIKDEPINVNESEIEMNEGQNGTPENQIKNEPMNVNQSEN